MYVNILSKNKKDVTGLLVFGSLALSFGFGIYYLLPLSLISFNFSMAMTLFLSILFGMIMALAILIINLMVYINSYVSKVLLFFERASTRLIVQKNLMAHQDRNRSTTMVLSLTLGFVIFLNIVARIPFAKDYHDELKIMGYSNIKIGRMNLPVAEMDHFLLENEYMFEDVGMMTN